uniref:AF10-like protein n=1 Tax=Phallusia mammillata TaxID=59560 RepID=A0A6F9DK89_9ASCI|nr:AF10-like protein [Phallusia mammillata]
MLGGCCVCLDERGWAENPLVYCDGQVCTIAVHQACYGIVDVPSGPWFCRKCELNEQKENIACDLCPHQDGALKKTDSGGWAHVVCALYIPEIEFGNVSTMEPIVLSKIPQERFDKECYICAEKNSTKKSRGACMDCAKAGCKLNFHVTCAQISGLLCEEAGSSNTTKYCGYCAHHLSKGKKMNPFKSLACSKVYKLSSSSEEASPVKELQRDLLQQDIEEPLQESNIPTAVTTDTTSTSSTTNITCEPDTIDSNPTEANVTSLHPLSTLAEAAACAIEHEKEIRKSIESCQDKQAVMKKKRQPINKGEGFKKLKRNIKKQQDESSRLKKKPKVIEPPPERQSANSNEMPSILEDVGYAVAPKHSVISLSSFGDASIIPSEPADIGRPKSVTPNPNTRIDGLTAMEHLIGQQRNDLLQFFQEFGSPDVAPVLDSLQRIREENSKLERTIDKLAHRRDQLLALKAKLSIPFKNTHISGGVVAKPELRIDNKPFSQT